MILLNIFIAFHIADVITGIFHWIEDAYLEPQRVISLYEKYPRFPFKDMIVDIAETNHLHHYDPMTFCKNTLIDNISSTLPFTILGIYSLLFIEGLMIYFKVDLHISSTPYLAILFASCGNLMHRFIHQKEQAPYPIRVLQSLYILQDSKTHNLHHISVTIPNHNHPGRFYCIYGYLSNIFLEYFNVWRNLEYIIETYLHIKPCHH